MSVMKELIEALKVKAKRGEDEQDHLRRLWLKANTLDDDAYNALGLSEEAQEWCNKAGEAVEAAGKLSAATMPVPAGAETAAKSNKDAEEDETPKVAKRSAAPKKQEAKVAKKAKAKTTAKPAKAAAKKSVKAKKAAKADGAGRGRPIRFDKDATIKLVGKENPHRKGTNLYKQWALYKPGMTIAEAIKKGATMHRMAYQIERGLVKVG